MSWEVFYPLQFSERVCIKAALFSHLPLRVLTIKTKINKWDLIKLKLLHNEGNQQNEKKTYRVGEKYFQSMQLTRA